MKLAFILTVVLSLWLQVAYLQQCQQITVCNENQVNSLKGDKGNSGSPGKAGPIRSQGEKGEVGVGEKGEQGESCALGSFESEMRQRLTTLETLLTPASCLTSSLYGRQTLRSGEEVFCDNGWTVFQRHLSNRIDFDQGWNEYKSGFGDLSESFWFGLEKVHNLTKDRGCKLRVDLWTRDNEHKYALYSDFYIRDESDNYRLHVGDYSGTAGDGLIEAGDSRHVINTNQFTTKDRDNDRRNADNCAMHYHNAGWWYNNCLESNLNRPVGLLVWDQQHRQMASTMKFRCD